MPNNQYIYAGGGILYILLVVALIAAKIAGHLTWGWWLILTPLWAPVVAVVVCVIFAIALFARSDNPFR